MSDEVMPFRVREFAEQAIIFRAGDPGNAAYVIESGSVEILLGPPDAYRRINQLGAGALFGEIALLDGEPRSATVRALTPTRLVHIQREHLDGLLGKSDPVVQYLVRVLLEHVRRSGAKPAPAAPSAAGPSLGAPSPGAPADLPGPRPALPQSIDSGPAREAAARLHERAIRTLTLAQSLSDAITLDQLELHYQPIIRFRDGKLGGFEALIRWRHPTLGMIRPDEFVVLAEKTDLIYRIGEFVLRRALTDWQSLRGLCAADAGYTPFMSINLSAPELCQPGIVDAIETALQRCHTPAAELRIELTETAVINNFAAVTEVTQQLRALGVGIALDDFGKGYGGLSYLQSLPFSCLKIDKAFVDLLHTSARSLQIVRSTVEMAAALGMSTVAEGIEDEATATVLAALGCDYAQGYHFARPMTVAAITAWHAARND
jgi:EAL domain-containing protein (putative c-di-GMP-specific phosphodiesterase class I)